MSHLSAAQLPTFKAHILANTATIPAGYPWSGAFVGVQVKDVPNDGGDGNLAVAGWYSLTATPDFWVYRRSYTPDLARASIIGTTGAANQLDALTGSKRDSLFWLIAGTIDMSSAAARASVDDLCGSQNTLKAAIQDGGKRKATRLEQVFATGGNGALATPGTNAFPDGTAADTTDVNSALNLA
jgi:hypothetical protein